MESLPLPRLDQNQELRAALLPYCRLRVGEIWEDSAGSHRAGCLDGDASLYVWLGADQHGGFQPLPDFMLMMRADRSRQQFAS